MFKAPATVSVMLLVVIVLLLLTWFVAGLCFVLIFGMGLCVLSSVAIISLRERERERQTERQRETERKEFLAIRRAISLNKTFVLFCRNNDLRH